MSRRLSRASKMREEVLKLLMTWSVVFGPTQAPTSAGSVMESGSGVESQY